jgi:iron complex outermembrane receptor protein
MLLLSSGQACLAQSATPKSTIVLAPILVEGVQAVPDDVQARFDALPGGATLVQQDAFRDSANLTITKALSSAPGVVVQDFFGGNDQPRVQIRGSGLQQNPAQRGILALSNGLPINRADGSYIVGLANPLQAETIEVYRGYMANRLGASVLGGALNFVSPTGSTQPRTTSSTSFVSSPLRSRSALSGSAASRTAGTS